MLRYSVLIALTAALAYSQGLGAKYATRDMHTCTSTKDPAKGPITPAKAKQYLECGYEHLDRDAELWLIDVQSVEVGKPRPFNIRADSSEADTTELVYPIRGHVITYICRKTEYVPDGKNCYFYDQPTAVGTCFRTGFGDWKCNMHGDATQQKGPGPKH